VGKRLVSFLGRTGGVGRSRRRTEVVLAGNTGPEEVRIAVAVELSASSFPRTSRPVGEIYWITLGWTVAASNLVSTYSNASSTTTSARSAQAGSGHAMAVEIR
jgi:hypothetical protein